MACRTKYNNASCLLRGDKHPNLCHAGLPPNVVDNLRAMYVYSNNCAEEFLPNRDVDFSGYARLPQVISNHRCSL